MSSFDAINFVPSLLQAIVLMDGASIVLHVGDRPYVVSEKGQISLTSDPMTTEAVAAVIDSLLPLDSKRLLEEVGATQCALPDNPLFPRERFTVVAARGGDDLWVEIRRTPLESADDISGSTPQQAPRRRHEDYLQHEEQAAHPGEDKHFRRLSDADPHGASPDDDHDVCEPEPSPVLRAHPSGQKPSEHRFSDDGVPEERRWQDPHAEYARSGDVAREHQERRERRAGDRGLRDSMLHEHAVHDHSAYDHDLHDGNPSRSESAPLPAPLANMPGTTSATIDQQPAIVLPLLRTPLKAEAPPPLAGGTLSGLDRLLRLAAARGASTLYLVSDAKPSIRIDGEVRTLDGAAVLGPNDVESLLLTLMPERSAEAMRNGVSGEWVAEFADLGRVRCLGFRDHRGPGGVFRIMPQRAITTEQLGLSREIQALASESEGLVVVTGPRLSGKRTLMSAFVDHINRTRHAHVITIERDINIVHEHVRSMVSQREARDTDNMADAVRSALREDPDVLVVEDVRTAQLAELTLEASASGRLVICGYPASSATAAIDGLIDLSPPSSRRSVQLSLAQHLLGVVAQVLLKKTGGGRLAARELLLNTPAVASLLAEGKTSQLPLAIEGGRKHGMVPLNDALGGFAQSGAVDVREAYRCSADRPALLALLQRQGIDVSAVERLA